jgi:hypothetical protein
MLVTSQTRRAAPVISDGILLAIFISAKWDRSHNPVVLLRSFTTSVAAIL